MQDWSRYSPEDDEKLTKMYLDYTLVKKISQELNRSEGSIRQRVMHLGLRRSMYTSRIVRWAPKELVDDFRAGGLSEAEFTQAAYSIRKSISSESKIKAGGIHKAIEERAKKIQERTDLTREEKMLAMRIEGATLDYIGKIYGITRERVRQLTIPKALLHQALEQLAHPEEVSLGHLIDVWDQTSEEVRQQFLELVKEEKADGSH